MMQWAIISIIIGTIIGTYGAYLMKVYSENFVLKEIVKPLRFIKKNLKLLWAIFLSVVSTFFFFPWLKFYDVSLIYPFTALTYVWAIILARWLLKEKITSFKVIGSLLIITGVVIIYLS